MLVTISDKKLGYSSNDSTVDYFNPQVVSAQDYYPFGMLQPGREFNVSGYRYGFNGKENDNEVKGEGNQIDYGARVYDARIGRFLSIDPLQRKYAGLTPYQFASNSPVDGIDLDGLEWYYYNFLYGWTESRYPKSIFLTEKEANAAGYLSFTQVHKLQEDQAQRRQLEEDRRKHEEAYTAAKKIQQLNNPFGLTYEFTVQTGVDAYNAYADGHYILGSLIVVGASADFAPLFKTFGKAYAGVATAIANKYTYEGIWKIENNFARGALYEAKIASEYISKGYTWMAESASQFFRYFDFYNAAEHVAVSLKTVNAKTNTEFKNIFKNIEELANLKKAGSTVQYGAEYEVKQVELHIAIPKNYDKTKLREVEKAAKREGIKVHYIQN